MLGSSTVHQPIISSMGSGSCKSWDQNLFFITWRIFSYSLACEFIILCNMCMMPLLLVRLGGSFVSGTISWEVAFLITCVASKICIVLPWSMILLEFLGSYVRVILPMPSFFFTWVVRASSSLAPIFSSLDTNQAYLDCIPPTFCRAWLVSF